MDLILTADISRSSRSSRSDIRRLIEENLYCNVRLDFLRNDDIECYDSSNNTEICVGGNQSA